MKPLFSFINLNSAWRQCKKNKRFKPTTSEFEFHLEKEIIRLIKMLRSGSYYPGCFAAFVITEPKTREIFAAPFCDRVVHHLVYGYLLPIFEPKFIFTSFACRPEKGTHLAVTKLRHFMRKRSPFIPKYYLQADIKNFFCSINQNILFKQIQRIIKNRTILWLCKIIIFHDCTKNHTKHGQLKLFSKVPPHKSLFNAPAGRGLAIGNLTSQFFANVYLDELDQFVKHKLKCPYYIRYVDDFVILAENKETLFKMKIKIENYLAQNLELELHPNKWKIKPISSGIDFLGYFIKPSHTLVRRRVIKNFKKKLHTYQTGNKNMKFILSSINSYYAHFNHAASYRLCVSLWENHFGILKKHLEPVDNFKYFRLRQKAGGNTS